ncbi:hypothetical protein TRIUR3_07262 [Triticum urartu]|nr:hypothetical protein TRIUR3_07262 [Triticum urartu]
MPDCDGPRTRVIEKVLASDWMDSVIDEEHAPPSVFLGPELVRQKLYQLSPEEDYTLCQSLARVSSYYVADQQQRPPFSAARYGAVTKVYVVAKQDMAMVEEYQRHMIAGIPVVEVREMANADHMVMFSAPDELAGHLADIANTYT